jgi:protein-S-isoprenylcysteine O-methyltransferase Ste14
MAALLTALPFAIGATLPTIVLWEDPNWLIWVRHGFSVAAVLAFIHTLKFYSLTSFLGLKTETWPLTFSSWHSYVRHPWYFLMLVIIWTQTMTETWLVSASCMTLYLIFGSRIEEKRILRHHPGSYAEYRRIVPGLIPWRGRALDETTRLRLESQALTES